MTKVYRIFIKEESRNYFNEINSLYDRTKSLPIMMTKANRFNSELIIIEISGTEIQAQNYIEFLQSKHLEFSY